MRFQVGQKIRIVHFRYDDEQQRTLATFVLPYMHDQKPVTKINIKELTVIEHHKVKWDYDDDTVEAKYDGYVLQDAEGNIYHNQYPRASYGQVTTTADWVFTRHVENDQGLAYVQDCYKNDPEFIYEGRELYYVLTDIVKGMIDLKKFDDEPQAQVGYSPMVYVKRKLLYTLYQDILTKLRTLDPDINLFHTKEIVSSARDNKSFRYISVFPCDPAIMAGHEDLFVLSEHMVPDAMPQDKRALFESGIPAYGTLQQNGMVKGMTMNISLFGNKFDLSWVDPDHNTVLVRDLKFAPDTIDPQLIVTDVFIVSSTHTVATRDLYKYLSERLGVEL